MNDDRTQKALSRIDMALSRLDRAAARQRHANDELQSRHEKLRIAVTQALGQLDTLIADQG